MNTPRKTRRLHRPTKLQLVTVAHKRQSYAERTGQNGRRAQIALSEAAAGHYTHAMIRQALLRQVAVEIEDLRAELPDAGISYALTKGWLHRSAGQGFCRVTLKAAKELELPAKNAQGQKIRFADGATLPPTLPLVDAPKPVTEARAAAIVAQLQQLTFGDVIAEARCYQAILAETRWSPAELARRLGGDDRKVVGRFWDRAIFLAALLTLEPEYQAAAKAGELSLPMCGELGRLAGAARADLYAAIKAGTSLAAIRRTVRALGA